MKWHDGVRIWLLLNRWYIFHLLTIATNFQMSYVPEEEVVGRRYTLVEQPKQPGCFWEFHFLQKLLVVSCWWNSPAGLTSGWAPTLKRAHKGQKDRLIEELWMHPKRRCRFSTVDASNSKGLLGYFIGTCFVDLRSCMFGAAMTHHK